MIHETAASQEHKLPNPKEKATPPLYNASVDDELFDETCDLGQFMLNPTWYIFVKIRGSWRDFQKTQTDIQSASKDAKRSSYLHLQRPLYFSFVIGGWTAVFSKVYPLIRASPLLSDTHIYTGYAVAATCVLSWKLSSSTSPGEINEDTIWRFDNYQYDNLLYVIDSICPTHHLRKLPRSKYDRITKKHIPRFDHFCGWLGQPIGEENYREFLIFVAVHALMCTYGMLVSGVLIIGFKQGNGLIDMLLNDVILTMIFGFLTLACVPLVGFFGFHMYLIANGMTTNEYYKWKLVHERHAAAKEQFQRQQFQMIDRDVEVSHALAPGEEPLADPGSHPCNLYDNGVYKNFLEVLSPRSLRRGREGLNKSE